MINKKPFLIVGVVAYHLIFLSPLFATDHHSSSNSTQSSRLSNDSEHPLDSPPVQKNSRAEMTDEEIKNTPEMKLFIQAIWQGDVEQVRKSLKEFPHLTSELEITGNNPFHVAAATDQLEVFKELEKLLPSDKMTAGYEKNGNTSPLHRAASLNSAKIVEYLLQKLTNEEITARNSDGNTPFQEAATYGSFDTCLLFLKKLTSEQIYEKNNKGQNFLHFAASMGSLYIFRNDLNKFINPAAFEEKDIDGNTPEDIEDQQSEIYASDED